ncbi:MAG: MurT ligase domain-containing protein [Candidatus Levyibacteriota bacterium]
MLNILLIIIGKLLSKISNALNLGSGSTWPGHIALILNKNFIKDILKNSNVKTVLIAGTNGKTTTGKLIKTILEYHEKSLPAHWRVFQNQSGANLLNGIASSMLLHSSILCELNYDYAIFEVDENTLPSAISELIPDYIILLNLFRDQLDRYGEIDSIAKKWKESLATLSKNTTLILNADDPLIAFLGKDVKATTKYFGIEKNSSDASTHQHASDSVYCPSCSNKLQFNKVYFSHLGDWKCDQCAFKRPKTDMFKVEFYPLSGIYNKYNTRAAILLAKRINIDNKVINSALQNFTPAFGRQETINIDGKKVRIFLSKNPTSFNESLKTVIELGGPARHVSRALRGVAGRKNLLFVLNDRIPDGRDVSWIWDTDIESAINDFKTITVSGDRCYDMGLRIKYTFNEFQIPNSKFQMNDSMKIKNFKLKIESDLRNAISSALTNTPKSETLYILPTYSAMLEVRKILTGRKIL